MIWELGTRERLAQRNFKVWELGSCSMPLQVDFSTLVLLYYSNFISLPLQKKVFGVLTRPTI